MSLPDFSSRKDASTPMSTSSSTHSQESSATLAPPTNNTPPQVSSTTLALPTNNTPPTDIRISSDYASASDYTLNSNSTLSPPTSLPPTPHLAPQLLLDTFEEDINADPQAHFLSPMASYEYWDDSDSDSGEDVQWDAGIVDFGLFYDDHKNADVPLPSKWNALLADQARAYQRTVQRTMAEAVEPEFLARTGEGDALPGLTPDASPLLRDGLEYDEESAGDLSASSTSTPHFTLVVSPPDEDLSTALASAAADPSCEGEGEDQDQDQDQNQTDADDFLNYSLPPRFPLHKTPRQPPSHPLPCSFMDPPLEKPGLRFPRTMSGKRHSWIKPGRALFSIREEEGMEERIMEEGGRGLRRGRTV